MIDYEDCKNEKMIEEHFELDGCDELLLLNEVEWKKFGSMKTASSSIYNTERI